MNRVKSLLVLGLSTLFIWSLPFALSAQTPVNSNVQIVPGTERVTLRAMPAPPGPSTHHLGPSFAYNAEYLPEGMFELTFDSDVPEDVQEAVTLAANLLNPFFNLTEVVNVHTTWNPSYPTNLGSCGPDWYLEMTAEQAGFSGIDETAPIRFAAALAKQLFDTNGLEEVGPTDLTLNLNSNRSNWYTGTDGTPPSGDHDMVTVAMHEIVHGMGFTGGLAAPQTGDDGEVTQSFATTKKIYDYFTQDASGSLLVDLTSDDLMAASLSYVEFNGANTVEANGGTAPALYTPNPWDGGSSYSHFDEDYFPPGDFNSLMTPFLEASNSNHTPGLVGLSLMEDLGFSVNKGFGCTNPIAFNYEAGPVFDDGSCIYPPGCTDPTACNYESFYTEDDGSCEFDSCILSGCTDSGACNYDPEATTDDGSCIDPICQYPYKYYIPFDFNSGLPAAGICSASNTGSLPPGPENYFEANFQCASELLYTGCNTWDEEKQNAYSICVGCGPLSDPNEPPILDTSSSYFDGPLVSYCDNLSEEDIDWAIAEIISNIGVTDECPDHVNVNYAYEFTQWCNHSGVYDLFLFFVDLHGAVASFEVQFTIVDYTEPIFNYNLTEWEELPVIPLDWEGYTEHTISELLALEDDIQSWPSWAKPTDQYGYFMSLEPYVSDNCSAYDDLEVTWEPLSTSIEFYEGDTLETNPPPNLYLNTLVTASDGCGNTAGQVIKIRLHGVHEDQWSGHTCGWWIPSSGSSPAILSCHSPGEGYEYAFCQECANEVIENDSFCEDNQWDSICEDAYQLCLQSPPATCQCDDIDEDFVCDAEDECLGASTTDYLDAGYFVREAFNSSGEPYYTQWLYLDGDGTGIRTSDLEIPEGDWLDITYAFCEPLEGPVSFIADPWYYSGTLSGDTIVSQYYSSNIEDDVTAYMFPAPAGCIDATACNFDPVALFDGGNCEYLSCAGCTNSFACNYDETATIDDGSCIFSGPECYCAEPIPFSTSELFPYQEVVFEWEGEFESVAALDIEFEFTSLNISQASHLLVGVCSPNGVCVEVGGYDLSLGFDDLGPFPAEWNTTASGYFSTTIDVSGTGLSGGGTWAIVLLNAFDVDGAVGIWDGKVTIVGMCDEIVVPGCTDSTACNYEDYATTDDGSCVYSGPLCQCTVDAEVETANLASGATESWTVLGNLSEVQTLEATLAFSDVNANFAGDLLVAICDPNGNCIEIGGYDMSLGYENESLWPNDWNTATPGTYSASIDLSAVGLNGDGEWTFTLMNAYSFSPALGNWSGTISLVGACGEAPTCQQDADGDGVCDDQDPCVGEVDACGVCNGPGAIYACGCFEIPEGACDCDGNLMDALGVCGGTCPADTNSDGICDEEQVFGCTDAEATNYNPEATADDESCLYGNDEYYGCTYPSACNYIPEAVIDDGSCIWPDPGTTCSGDCINDTDGDGICDEWEIPGCSDEMALNWNPLATDESDCEYPLTPGCMDAEACNYSAEAEYQPAGICWYPQSEVLDCNGACLHDEDGDGVCDEFEFVGCLDPDAVNYAAYATDEGPCVYPDALGCTYTAACNYDEFATADDGTCSFPEAGLDCDGNSIGSGSTCVADLDESGWIDVGDLLLLLSAYGSACE